MKFALPVRNPAPLLFAYFFLLALSYSWATPIFEAPDEASHFLYAHNILAEGRLPLLEERETVIRSHSSERHQAPLYYLFGATVLSLTERSSVDELLQFNPFAWVGVVGINNQNTYLHSPYLPTDDTLLGFYSFRFFTVLLTAGTLWFTYGSARLLAGERVGTIALLLAASIPTFIFIGSSLNNDNMVTFLYAAGVYWFLRRWEERRITNRHLLLLMLIVGGLAISKLNGIPLIGLIGLGLLVGAYTRRWTWRTAGMGMIAIAVGVGVLAAWYFIRNLTLYGDLFGLDSTNRIWGRGALNSEPASVLGEAWSIWQSFWFVLGYLNIRGPDWVFYYVSALTLIGGAGIVRFWRKQPGKRPLIAFLVSAIALLLFALLLVTRQINASQGRFLFPGIVAFAPLVAIGLAEVVKARWATVALLPLVVATAIIAPAQLHDTYQELQPVAQLPPDATPIMREAEGLTLAAYRVETPLLQSGETLEVSLWFSGYHPANPFLIVKALDPTTLAPLGGVDIYPGMSPTQPLRADTLYHAVVRFRIDSDRSMTMPHQVGLIFDWREIDPQTELVGRYLDWSNGDAPTALGPVLLPSQMTTPAFETAAGARFGDSIQLEGYTLRQERGELRLDLAWSCLEPLLGDWVVAVGLLDASGNVAVQADAAPEVMSLNVCYGGLQFNDPRVLDINELASGEYQLYVGWYRLDDGQRLAISGSNAQDNLYRVPERIVIP
jgi:hypothetical protein